MILTHGANSLISGGPGPGTVEIDGRNYSTIIMPDGNEWLAENLDYKFQVDGKQITLNIQWTVPNYPAAWYYNRDEASFGIDGTYKCGLLYNGFAARYLEANRETLLPDGWHVPSYTEWQTLKTAIGNDGGAKLKAIDNSVTSSWPSEWNGTNETGFNALPAGMYQDDRSQWLNVGTLFWSSTNNAERYDYIAILKNDDTNMVITHKSAYTAFSIRLIKTAS